MADEHQFIEDGLRRSQINEFFADELGRAGYGGMDVAKTPMGTQIVLKAEKPGMVIGKGGKNIRKITTELEDRFDMDDPQIDVQEVDEPDLNAQIVADRLANALERGWYFPEGRSHDDRPYHGRGRAGAEIVPLWKGYRRAIARRRSQSRLHQAQRRARTKEVVDHGQGVAVMKLGTIGVNVKIIPPGAQLPDDFDIREDADVPEVEQAAVDVDADEGVESLLEEEPEEVPDVGADDDVEIPTRTRPRPSTRRLSRRSSRKRRIRLRRRPTSPPKNLSATPRRTTSTSSTRRSNRRRPTSSQRWKRQTKTRRTNKWRSSTPTRFAT